MLFKKNCIIFFLYNYMLEALLWIIVRELEVAGASIKQTTKTTIEKYEQALPSKYCRNKYSQIWVYACT